MSFPACDQARQNGNNRVYDTYNVDFKNCPRDFRRFSRWAGDHLLATNSCVRNHHRNRQLCVNAFDKGSHAFRIAHIAKADGGLRTAHSACLRNDIEPTAIASDQRQANIRPGGAARQCGSDAAAGAGQEYMRERGQ
jgi:hypothetical protein